MDKCQRLQEIIELRKRGILQKDIGAQYGISPARVSQILNEAHYFPDIASMPDIKALRVSKGLTQNQLAHLLNCEGYTIRRYEAGKTKPRRIYAEVLEKIKAGELDGEIEKLKARKNKIKTGGKNETDEAD